MTDTYYTIRMCRLQKVIYPPPILGLYSLAIFASHPFPPSLSPPFVLPFSCVIEISSLSIRHLRSRFAANEQRDEQGVVWILIHCLKKNCSQKSCRGREGEEKEEEEREKRKELAQYFRNEGGSLPGGEGVVQTW